MRGKAKAKIEFEAKLEISIIDGYARVEKLSWEAYNESETLEEAVNRYYERFGYYPERVLADKIYRNKSNLNYCKEKGIRLSGPKLGRPKKDDSVDKKVEYQDHCDRNQVEGKFKEGKFKEGKVAYGWNLIKGKLKESSEVMIQMIAIGMNLMHQLRRGV